MPAPACPREDQILLQRTERRPNTVVSALLGKTIPDQEGRWTITNIFGTLFILKENIFLGKTKIFFSGNEKLHF